MRKLKLLLASLCLIGSGSVWAQTDVTASYIGDVNRIIQGGGHSCSSNKHVLSNAGGSQGEGYFNTQNLGEGWHNFVANTANVTNGVESWTGSAGGEGWILGRQMVLPQGKYTLKFTAMTNNIDNTVLKCGDQEKNFNAKDTYEEYSFDIDVTTANTAYQFGIYQKEGGTANWSVMGNMSLTLTSTDITPVANNSISDFAYSGSQTWHTNTWSTEGNSDNTNFITPFHELWVGSGSTLNDATITGTYTPTANGVYKVSAWVRAMNEAGGDISGVKIFVGDVESDACAGSSVRDGKGRLGTFSAMADGVSGTPFSYGFKIKDATLNWLSFKNVTITYYAEMPEAEKTALLALVPTGKMNATIQTQLNTYKTAFESNASVANYNALSLYIPTAQASVDVYESINSTITSYATKAAALDAAGAAAYDASAIQTKYDNGTYETLAEAEAELAAAFVTATKAQTTAGSDWTGVIVNPSFENGFTGWTNSGMGTQSNTSFGKTGTYYAEAWQPDGTKSLTQTITAMPAGVYRLSARAKARSVTSAKISAAGIDQAITIADSEDNYSVEFACDANASVTIAFEGVGTGASASWLCVDNFTLTLVSAGLPDVVAVTGKMNAEVESAQTAAINAYNSNKTVSNYNAASAAIAAAQTSKDAYTAANAAITKAEALQTANTFVTSDAATTFAEAIAAIKTPYTNGTLSNDDANAAGTTLGVSAVGWHSSATATPAANYIGSTWGGKYTINDWSVEGDSDGSDFSVPFFQNWIADASSLAATTMTGTLTGLTTGTYKVTAWVRVRAKNETAATDATGITMDVNGGEATDVTEGTQVGTSQFQLATYEATGYVLDDGTLNVNFNIADGNNVSWLSFKNITYTRTGDVPAADADDYTALAAAITATGEKVAGFETGEYAPYTNKEAFAALAAAKAINPEATNVKSVVQAATTALTGATWTANTVQMNAVYNGTFALSTPNATSGVDVDMPGWTLVEGIRLVINNTTDYPGLTSASGSAAVFSWGGTALTYGEKAGYTMPLAGHTIYELTAKIAGWKDGDMPTWLSASVLKESEGMASMNILSTSVTKRISETDPFVTCTIKFVTDEAGDYVLSLSPNKNNVLTDISITKAANQYLEFADGSVPNYAPGTYPSVKITRSLAAGKWVTAVYPFPISNSYVDNIAVLSSYNKSTGALGFTSATPVASANVPFLMKSTTDKNEITLDFSIYVAAAAATDATASEASLKGVYAATTVDNSAKNYVLSNNTIYAIVANSATVNPYRAYIQIAQDAEARNLTFTVDGEVTAIEGITAGESGDGVVYNLQGQRVVKAQKGLYIKDGRKVMIK